MKKTDTSKLVTAALMAALICAATLVVRIPVPGTQGYVHPGDAFVILSGILLGPAVGFLAGGIGSALADLAGGYVFYVPVTFVIKGLAALVSALISRRVPASGKRPALTAAICGLADILLVVGGYFICEIFLYGTAVAALSVPANIVQGFCGLAISVILFPILLRVPEIRRLMT